MQLNYTQDSDERAVSPVIGVIMMVAVTVILAAIVSMLVLGMGSDLDVAPQASFGFEYDGTNVTISHEGGDALDTANLEVKVGSADAQDWPDSGDLTAGDSASFAANSTDTVRVIWVADSGDTTILATYKVP